MGRHAEIAGAGFAGLTLATALAQRGWTARVHERAADLRSDGAGIFLWENGLRTLAELGIAAEVEALGHAAAQWEERDRDGRVLGIRPIPVADGVRLISLIRQDLHAAVLRAARAAGVDVRTRSEAVAAEPAGVLVTADGRRWAADLVAGADGVHSRVRDALGLLDAHETFEDFRISRFVVPLARAPRTDGQWRNYVDHWDLEARRRVMTVPCNARDLYLLLGAFGDDDALRRPLDPAPWCRSFPLLEPVLAEIPGSPHVGHYEAVRVRRWSAGRVAIVGDAAHAMPPTMGQGAGTAMTNALALARALERDDDVEGVLRAWEAAERPETDETQRGSIDRMATLLPRPQERRDAWDDRPLRAARRRGAGEGTPPGGRPAPG